MRLSLILGMLRWLDYMTVGSSKASLHRTLTGCTSKQESRKVMLSRCTETLDMRLVLVVTVDMNSMLLKKFLQNMATCPIARSAAAS